MWFLSAQVHAVKCASVDPPDEPDVAAYERAGVTWWLVAPRAGESAEAFGRLVDAGPPL